MEDLVRLLPHRPPMVLIDGVEAFDPEAKRVVVSVKIDDSVLFFSDGGVPSWVAIEYMAQAAATLAGLRDRLLAPDCAPRAGMLLGTRRMDVELSRFVAGETYHASAECVFEDSDAASFQCEIRDVTDRVVASATLNAYRPPDMAAFLKEHAST